MSSSDYDFKFENFQEYYGDAAQVKKIMNECKICNAKLVTTHLSDYKNLMVQETARCPDCGGDHRKLIHALN